MYIQLLSAFVSLFLLCGDTEQTDHSSSTYELRKAFSHSLSVSVPPDQQVKSVPSINRVIAQNDLVFSSVLLLSRSTLLKLGINTDPSMNVYADSTNAICSIGGNCE